MSQIDRVVGGRTQVPQHLHVPPGVGRGEEDRLEKVGGGEMLGAAKSEQLSTRRQQAQSLKINLFVPFDASRDVLAAADERRRIEDNEVKQLSRLAQVGKHVCLNKLTLTIKQIIRLPIPPGKLQSCS